MSVMTKEEADKKCMRLFGMNSEDYAKRILEAWKEEKKSNEPEVTA